MTERRRTVLLVATLLILVVGVGAEWLAHGTRIGFGAVRDLLTGWLVAGGGLVAWGWVPRSRTGPLLVIAGLAWFVGTAADPLTATGQLASTLRFVYVAVIVQAVLTWPDGRLSRPLDRILVVAAYLVTLFPPLWERDLGLIVIASMIVGALAAGSAGRSERARRMRRPAVVVGIALAVALASKGEVASLLRRSGVTYPGDSEAVWQIALVIVALGLAASLIALERRRRGVTDLVVRLGAAHPIASAVELAATEAAADEQEIAEAMRRAEEMATRNARLRDELSGQVSAIEDSRRRLLDAEDDERAALRSRLWRGTISHLETLSDDLAATRPAIEAVSVEAGTRLERAIDQLRRAIVELDDLARGLDPAMLRERGLAEALADLAARSPIPVELTVGPTRMAGAGLERTLFYVASESLANVAKHARAGRAWLHLSIDDAAASLAIEDDGVGLADTSTGSGLAGLRDRVDAVGGAIEIASRRPSGTSVRVTIPLTPAASA